MKNHLLSFTLCAGIFLSCFTAVNASAEVVSDIAVCTTLDSSKTISELTANDEYKAYDAVYSLNDTSVNRMTSEHFQIIWGNSDTSGEVNYAFVKGNLINLENIRSFYIDELGMKDIGISMDPRITEKRKTNIYISGTGLTKFEDDWAYMSVDRESFAYLFVAPGAMRVDEPSWVLPHELAHAFTYHQGGNIPGAWYESTANWFRDTYLGSEYYAYGGRTYGPTSDFFTPYARYSNYYVPHMLQWYDTWPLFTYIAENPDNIEGLGMPLMHKIFEYNAPVEDSMFTTIEKLSGVSSKEVLAGFTRRMANYDFSRQEFYLMRLKEAADGEKYYNNKDLYAEIYTALGAADSEGWQQPAADKMPMASGFNVIPITIDKSMTNITAEIANTSTEEGADFRTSIVTAAADNTTRYSNIVKGSGTARIGLNGDEEHAWLVVCAAPDVIKNYEVDWNSSAEDMDTRYTYKVRINAAEASGGETPAPSSKTAAEILSSPDYTVTDNIAGKEGELKISGGSVEFHVYDNAEVTVGYKCGSTNSQKSAAVVINGVSAPLLNGSGGSGEFCVSDLNESTVKITAVQYGNTSAQINFIKIYYPISGDANKDSLVNNKDAALVLKHISAANTITDKTSLKNADMDNSGEINIMDAIKIVNDIRIPLK